MKAVAFVNEKGYFIEDVVKEDHFSGVIPFESNDHIVGYFVADPPVPEGLYSPKWDINKKEWIEGMSKKEIDALNNQTVPIGSDQRIKDLEQQNLSLMDAAASMFEQLISVQAQVDKLMKK